MLHNININVLFNQMKELKLKFVEVSNKFPYHSTLVNFLRTIRSLKNLKWETVRSAFNQLVDKSDYEKDSKIEILNLLKNQTPSKVV